MHRLRAGIWLLSVITISVGLLSIFAMHLVPLDVYASDLYLIENGKGQHVFPGFVDLYIGSWLLTFICQLVLLIGIRKTKTRVWVMVICGIVAIYCIFASVHYLPLLNLAARRSFFDIAAKGIRYSFPGLAILNVLTMLLCQYAQKNIRSKNSNAQYGI